MDKIKISLNANVLVLLKKDCADFGVTKTNGEINFNAFINTLVANFYQQFSAQDERLVEQLSDAIDVIAEKCKPAVLQSVLKVVAKREMSEEGGKNVVFAFKPTKVSQKANDYIQATLLASESLSSYYRRLFTCYAHKPKNEREQIIFSENLALLNKAIKKGVSVLVTLKNGQILNGLCVYAVGNSHDELFNYTLLYKEGKNYTVRLAKIQDVSLLTTKADIPKENALLFDKQMENGIQYPFYNTDLVPIKVQLTDKGKKLFEKVYLYRPKPISIDGDVYTFCCSQNQLLYYFERFGENALILEPKRIGRFMRNYYYYAYKKYKQAYKD